MEEGGCRWATAWALAMCQEMPSDLVSEHVHVVGVSPPPSPSPPCNLILCNPYHTPPHGAQGAEAKIFEGQGHTHAHSGRLERSASPVQLFARWDKSSPQCTMWHTQCAFCCPRLHGVLA